VKRNDLALVLSSEKNVLRPCIVWTRVTTLHNPDSFAGATGSGRHRSNRSPPTLLLKPEPLIIKRVPPARLPRLGVTDVMVTAAVAGVSASDTSNTAAAARRVRGVVCSIGCMAVAATPSQRPMLRLLVLFMGVPHKVWFRTKKSVVLNR